jgi:hypothetical protein
MILVRIIMKTLAPLLKKYIYIFSSPAPNSKFYMRTYAPAFGLARGSDTGELLAEASLRLKKYDISLVP